MQLQPVEAFPHLCSFREYIFTFFSCISWDFSVFAALLSIYATCGQPRLVSEIFFKKTTTTGRGDADEDDSSLRDAAGSVIFTGRGEKSAQTSFRWAVRLQEKRVNSFIAVLRRQEEETTCVFFFLRGGFNWVRSCNLGHGAAAAVGGRDKWRARLITGVNSNENKRDDDEPSTEEHAVLYFLRLNILTLNYISS